MTLGQETMAALRKHAGGRSASGFAAELIKTGLARRAHRDKLRRDYVAGRRDARELLEDFEVAQMGAKIFSPERPASAARVLRSTKSL